MQSRDGVVEDCPRPRGHNSVALALKCLGLGLEVVRPWT